MFNNNNFNNWNNKPVDYFNLNNPLDSFNRVDSFSNNIQNQYGYTSGYKLDSYSNNILNPYGINSGYKIDNYSGNVINSYGCNTGIKLDPFTNSFKKIY